MKEKQTTVDLSTITLQEGIYEVTAKSKKSGRLDSAHSNKVTYDAKPRFKVQRTGYPNENYYYSFVRGDTWDTWINSKYNDGKITLNDSGKVLFDRVLLTKTNSMGSDQEQISGTSTIDSVTYNYVK